MNFRFLVPGKPKEDFLVSGIREYSKRLSKFGKVQIEYLPEERLSPKPSQEEIIRALAKEGERALLRIKDQEYLFLLDIHAKEISTPEFSSRLSQAMSRKGNLVFLFGSSYGLADALRKRSDFSFSLSPLTFTHYMAFLLTLEQVYRGCKIQHGEAYDK